MIENRENRTKVIIAKHCELDGIKFDSLGERDFYVQLVRVFGLENVYRAGKIEIIPNCPNSPGMYWDADFEVFHKGQHKIFEYKGSLKKEVKGNREFMHKWAMINSHFSKCDVSRFHVFIGDLYYPIWNTSTGKRIVQNIHALKLMSDLDIKDLFSSNI